MKFYYIIILLFLNFIPEYVIADNAKISNDLTGVVVDKDDNTPIIGATIYIESLNSGTITDTNGKFLIQNIPASQIELSVRYLGYQLQNKKIDLSGNSFIKICLEKESFKLNEVNVMAEKKSELSNYTIKNKALEYIQPSGLSDILQLLPGYLQSDGSLASMQQITVRQAGKDQSTALGTSIIVDGTPLSNNGNLSKVNDDSGINDKSNMNGGIDLRSIPSDHIEEIQIINGIASAKYGDITSGAVLIKSKAGRSPLTVRAKLDPLNKLVYAGKGFVLSPQAGNLNVGLDWANAKPDVRNSLEAFQRISGQAIYSNQFKFDKQLLSLNAKLNYTTTIDKMRNDPDLMHQTESFSIENQRINASIYGRWWVNQSFVKSIAYNFSANQTIDRTSRTKIIAQKNASPVAVEGVSGEHEGFFLPSEYVSSYEVIGKPLQLFGSIDSESFFQWGVSDHKLAVGINTQFEKNNGKGMIYDPLLPPVAGVRNRPFNQVPGIGQWAIYAEDQARGSLRKHEWMIQAGLRLGSMFGAKNHIHIQNKIYPELRLQTEWSLPKFRLAGSNENQITLIAGWGQQRKYPTLSYLFPETAWFDAVALNYYSQTEANRLAIMNSQAQNRENYDLKPALNTKAEFGIRFNRNAFQGSVTVFNENLDNGFMFTSQYNPFVYTKYEGLKNPVTGKPSVNDFNSSSDTLLMSYSKPQNGERVIKKGIEYRLSFPQIDVIKTSIEVNGAWYKTTYDVSEPIVYRPGQQINNRPYPYVGIYGWNSNSKSNQQLNTNIWFNTHLPKYRMHFSCMLQTVWYTQSQSLKFDGKPSHYLSYDGELREYTDKDAVDPVKKLLIRSFSDNYFKANRTPISMSMNIKATKEFGKHLTVSCFVNRIWDYNPIYKNSLDTNRRKWDAPFFGTEIKVSI
ncbi:MAG: TonB-dependent receptor [Bacteroidales bacterium]